jgi:hypothetical protein
MCRLIEIESKIHAIEDCMNVFKLVDDLPMKQVMDTVRKLGKKQCKLIVKRNKLLVFIH